MREVHRDKSRTVQTADVWRSSPDGRQEKGRVGPSGSGWRSKVNFLSEIRCKKLNVNAALDLHNVSLFLVECHHVSWFVFVCAFACFSPFFVSITASLVLGLHHCVLLNLLFIQNYVTLYINKC